MGLLTGDNKPEQDALAVVARLYAGLLFDDMCDFYNDMRSVTSVCRELLKHLNSDAPSVLFFYICSAYDDMNQALPEPIWWIAGNREVVSQFTRAFIRRLSEFTEGSEVMQ